MAVGHGHSDGTQRLGASEEEDITALPMVQSSSRGASLVFQSFFLIVTLFIWMLLQLTHPHTPDRCTAQLKSMLLRSDSAQSDTRRKEQSVKMRVMKHLVGSAGCMPPNIDAQALRGCCCICNAYDDAFIIRFKFIPW